MTVTTPTAIAILADDLTGANDTAVQFARAGIESHLLLGERPEPARSAHGLVASSVSADTRALPSAAAALLTRDVLDGLLAPEGGDQLYVKIDSTIRGSVAAQVRAALDVCQQRHPGAIAIVCPAYPALGRTVEGSNLLVNGIPVSETALATDPVTPVTVSDLTELIPGALPLSIAEGATLAEAVAAAIGTGAVYIADAADEEALAQIAEAIAVAPAGAIMPVGSAGLAGELARRWAGAAAEATPALPAAASVVVQVSSQNPVSLAQTERLREHFLAEGSLLLEPPLAVLLDEQDAREWLATQNLDATGPHALIVAPRERTGGAAQRIARSLGAITAEIARRRRPDALGLIGGDGARAALAALGVSAMRIVGALEEGIPVGIASDGSLPDVAVFTKAGGFGSDDSILHAVQRLIATTEGNAP